MVHDFTDPEWDTRFLGDLYQDLSEAARKKYALLQTPEFVEEFILDRTLTPAIAEFGFREVRLIDPACFSAPAMRTPQKTPPCAARPSCSSCPTAFQGSSEARAAHGRAAVDSPLLFPGNRG